MQRARKDREVQDRAIEKQQPNTRWTAVSTRILLHLEYFFANKKIVEEYYDRIKMEVEYLDRKIAEIRTSGFSSYSKTGILLAIFQSPQCKFLNKRIIVCNKYLEEYNTQYKGIKIERAPEPYSIRWENLHISQSKIMCSSFFSWIVVGLVGGAAIGTTFAFSLVSVCVWNIKPKRLMDSVEQHSICQTI
eukprot:TRINITY_DN70980_c0_g1_i1.p5 TRINITY_DN70980_c0_g1~~TRINITY_DN70980_c0_g1_i1.p5  ORF type:complete len:190 (-),score=10.66 TRINITY_DN70980_c0_g1_i1:2682-3251(-)